MRKDIRTFVAGVALAAMIGVGGLGIAKAQESVRQGSQSPTPKANPKVTFAEDVAPIIYKKCASCHRPGEVAPFSLDSYEEVKKRADMVALVTGQHLMPPWKTLPTDVKYANENRLSDSEIATIKAWADQGAPLGDASKMPEPPTSVGGWALGKPDLVVQMPEPFHLAADGRDEYWNFVIDPKLEKPVYVAGLDVKPGNNRVVHHVIAFLDKSGKSAELATQPGSRGGGYMTSGGGIGVVPSGALGGWAPGVAPAKFEKGVGFLLEPGTKIVLQVHYHKSGKPEIDQTKLGLYFQEAPVKTRARIAWLAALGIKIPAGDSRATFQQTFVVPNDTTLYTVMPHMHKLGKAMKATAVFPDGSKKVLVDVPNWDFNWQLVYTLKEPLHLPKGTKIVLDATYDNSSGNPNNPNDPPKDVRWGEQTSDEMMLLVCTVSFKGFWMYVT